jgi:hypothetical protein
MQVVDVSEYPRWIEKVTNEGGLASAETKHSKTIGSEEPDLTLEGLRILHERNTKSPKEP